MTHIVWVYEIILTALSWVNIENIIFTEDERVQQNWSSSLPRCWSIHTSAFTLSLFVCQETTPDLPVSQADTPVHSHYLYLCARRQHLIYLWVRQTLQCIHTISISVLGDNTWFTCESGRHSSAFTLSLFVCQETTPDLPVSQADTPVFMGCMGPVYHHDIIVLDNHIVMCKHPHAQHSDFHARSCTMNQLLTTWQLLQKDCISRVSGNRYSGRVSEWVVA